MKDVLWIGLDYDHDPMIDPSGADTSFVITGGFQENNPDLKQVNIMMNSLWAMIELFLVIIDFQQEEYTGH